MSRFGLALHDKEYFYNEVFVGKDGKLYAIPRLTPEDVGRLGFLILILFTSPPRRRLWMALSSEIVYYTQPFR